MLNLSPKTKELLTQKYIAPIAVLGTPEDKMKTIINTENGTLFHISRDLSYSFKDQNGNHWHTLLQCFPFEDKLYYPILGDKYILNERMTITFTTEETVVEIASRYFEQFLEFKPQLKTAVSTDFSPQKN